MQVGADWLNSARPGTARLPPVTSSPQEVSGRPPEPRRERPDASGRLPNLRRTPPDGEAFVRMTAALLARENGWLAWKAQGCAAYERTMPQRRAEEKEAAARIRKLQADRKRKSGALSGGGNSNNKRQASTNSGGEGVSLPMVGSYRPRDNRERAARQDKKPPHG